MEGLLVRISFLLSILFSTTAYAQTEIDCISHEDLEEISQEFPQFEKYLGNQDEYCESDMGAEWLKIANSLNILKNNKPNEPDVDQDDALTYRAISEKDWWAYFTKRAKSFKIDTQCAEGVGAYVIPFFGNGVIYLCNLFFDITVSSQASIMMHEVRHFDGHSHVTCTQGKEKGNGGACDDKITGKGSYAISVQTLVGMARSEDTNPGEKPLLEAEAVYMAFNKFNKVPRLKMNTSIILSNESGDVYDWNLEEDVELIASLEHPSVVINSSNKLTIYPLNTNYDAYRTGKDLKVKSENPGLYAVRYNSETPEERETYKSISYFGTGGLLKGNTLLTLCDRENLEIGETDLSDKGEFISIISMSLDVNDQTRESLLLSEDGDLYRYKCKDKSSKTVEFEKADIKIAKNANKVVDSFGFNGDQYALLEDGSLSIVSIKNNIANIGVLNLPVDNKDWVSATPFSFPEVF